MSPEHMKDVLDELRVLDPTLVDLAVYRVNFKIATAEVELLREEVKLLQEKLQEAVELSSPIGLED